MAKLVITLAFFLLFSLSQSQSLPQSDPNPRDDHHHLLLPSDHPRSSLPDDTLSSAAVADPNPSMEDPQPNRDGFVSLPLTKLDFHEGSIPLSLRFPHRRHVGRGCRHGFMRRRQPGMPPRQLSYGNDMILSDGKEASQESVGRSRLHLVNRMPGIAVYALWKAEEDLFQRLKEFEHGRDVEDEDVFKRPKKFKHGHHHGDDDDKKEDKDMFKRPKKFRHHDDDDGDLFNRPKKFDHDDEFRALEMVGKKYEGDSHIVRMPRKFNHHDDDDEDWHIEKNHHQHRFGRHHHKHHHHDDDDEDDNKGGIFSKMRKFFDDLF